MKMIVLDTVSKIYKGINTDNKDSGIYLWIKNFFLLTRNKATTLLAINHVSFSVSKGEIFGIYGANGAGKTTLIKLLSGLLGPTDGTIRIDGNTNKKNIKDKVSYISTNGWMVLEWQLTARENLMLYGNMFGISSNLLKDKCNDVLEEMGMTESKDKYISQLSAGMRQKITIARGLILDRPIIFYDEPSVSLDVQSAQSLRILIKTDALKNNRTAIIASHNPEDLMICNRLMLLSKGEIIAIGTLDELKKPLMDSQIIEIKCLYGNQDFDLSSIHGIDNIKYSNVEGKRDYQNITIHTRKSQFSFNELIDHIIEKNMSVLDIKFKEITIEEIYQYYLTSKEGGKNDEISS